MKTLEEYLHLVKEWHPTKNGNLTPNKVTHGSQKKVWWKCSVSDDHEWETTISARTAKGRGLCPFCSGRKVSKTNSLKTCFPKTAKEWHPTKNGNLTPDKITGGSHKKVWWKCIVADDHEWEASVKSRSQLIGARGCPFCSKSGKASSTNNLALNNPEIAKQWHPTKNGDLTPKQVRSNSTKKVWWLCVEGHEYLHSVNQRTSRTIKCPICSGYRIEQGNSLADKFPDIAAEWDFEKNGDITPDKISARNNKKYWYKCKLNHSYNSRTADRTTGGGCPKCTTQSSQPELRIYSELKYLFADTLNKHKVKNVELDIFIPSLKLAVEYDGSYWHKKSEKRDIRKNHFCQRNGMKLIRVRQTPLPKILDTDIIFSCKKLQQARDE